MNFFLFLFGICFAVWPPEKHQETRVLRVLGYYVPDTNTQWDLDYTDWSNSTTLDLAREFMEEIEDKIGSTNVEIDLLWFEKYCPDALSTCQTMAFFSRKEDTRENFHQYHDKYLETVEKFPENFPFDETKALESLSTAFDDWYRIDALNNKHVIQQRLHFLGNISCSDDQIVQDIETILCKDFWTVKNDGCIVFNLFRGEDYLEGHQFTFDMAVSDAYHLENLVYHSIFYNYPEFLWDKEQFKNLSLVCVETNNYPKLFFVEDYTSFITENEWIFMLFGAGAFLIAISWASFGCCFSQKCVRISSMIPILLLSGLVAMSYLLWFNYDNEFMKFYMLPTCAALSAFLLIYLPLACCCLRGRQRRMVIKPAKSEKDKVGLSKL